MDFGYYDSIKVYYIWEIFNLINVKEGDIMEFVLFLELKIVIDLDFFLKDYDGNMVGYVIVKKLIG